MSRHHRILFNSRRWQRVRLAVLDRDGWRCCACGLYGNEVDHVVPLDRGGAAFDFGNLQTLCRTDHIQKTREENTRPPTPAEAAWREMIAAIPRNE